MHVLDYVGAEGSVSRANMSGHSDVVETTALSRQEDICRVIDEGLDRSLSLAEFSTNDNCALDRTSGTSGDDGVPAAQARLRAGSVLSIAY